MELDVADPAHAELDVALLLPARAQPHVDPVLHRPDLPERLALEPGAVDDLARQVDERLPDPLVPGGHPRLDQRLALPEDPARRMVAAVGGERQRQRTAGPLGPEPEVDPVDGALLRHRGQRPDQLLGQAREVRPARHDLRSVRLALVLVDEAEVDVGRVVELGPPVLAERDHREAGGRPLAVRADVHRPPVPLAESRLHHRAGLRQTRVGQLRQLLGRRHEIRVPEQVPEADPAQLAALHPAKRVEPRLVGPERAARAGHFGVHRLAGSRPHHAGIEEPGHRLGRADQRVGQELARRDERRQDRDGFRVGGEQDVEAAPVERGRREALEVVERHVGIGGDAQVVEQPGKERRHLVAQVGRLGEPAEVRERAVGVVEAQVPEGREAGRWGHRRIQKVAGRRERRAGRAVRQHLASACARAPPGRRGRAAGAAATAERRRRGAG